VVITLETTLIQEMSDEPQIYVLVELLDVYQNFAASFKLSIGLLSDISLKVLEKPSYTVPRLDRLK
jgi:hypothetical protein